jgi:hypothetical protein
MIGKVRRLHYRQQKSVREIARITSLSRNTVRKWLKAPVAGEPKYRRAPRPGKLTAFHQALQQALKVDAHRPKRDRRTAHALYAEIYADFKALKALLAKQSYADDELATVPVLNRSEFALADVDSLMVAGWPKQVGIEARGILAVTTYLGALDFADNKPASFESNQKREYHHIFPDALLAEAGINSYLALNCAFITWKTNRIIGRKDPIDYLQDRVEWAGEESVRERMKSHLIDFDLLASASYVGLEGAQLATKLKPEFQAFLASRAKLVHRAMLLLTSGKSATVSALQADLGADPAEPQAGTS